MKKTNEKWNDIKGFEGYYQVSTTGRVKSLDRDVKCTSKLGNEFISHKEGRILKPTPNSNGYLSVVLAKDGETRTSPIHRLVAETFIPNPQNLNTVHHINGNHQDNRVENLEWIDCEEHNRIHGIAAKTVYVYTKDLQLLLTFNSTKEAARELGISQGNVVLTCNGILPHYHSMYFSYTPLTTQEDVERLHQEGQEGRTKRARQVDNAQVGYRERNKEKLRQIALSWYYNHRDQVLKYQRERYHKQKIQNNGNMERYSRL